MGRPSPDLTGQKFQQLLVVCRAPSKRKDAMWKCLCDCGDTCFVTSSNLKTQQTCGHIGSCKQYYERHPELLKSPTKRWELRHPDRFEAKKIRQTARVKAERKTNPPKYTAQELKKRFGLSLDQFDEILRLQGGGCDICGVKEPGGPGGWWHTDHDHACCPSRNRTCGGCIRGILCSNCNLALGNAQDSEEILLKMVQYLRDYSNRTQTEVI